MTIPSETLMRCATCKEYKPPVEMTANTLKGRENSCRICYREYSRDYAAKHRDKINKYHREWRAKLGDKYRETWVNRRKKKIAAMNDVELKAFRLYENQKAMRLYRVLKQKVFDAYNGTECACCGETEKVFLTVDHKLNNGASLKKEGVHDRSSAGFYRWIIKNNYPEEFQILCMNCNIGKHWNHGICPHKERVTTIESA